MEIKQRFNAVRDQKIKLERAALRDRALTEAELKFSETIPPLYKSLWVKSRIGEASPRQAIKSKCQECCGFEDVKIRISECKVIACSLWKYRPYKD